MKTSALCATAALCLSAAGWFVLPASAANATQEACSQQYQAAKSANTLNGQKWSDFYHNCAANMKSSGAATTAAPATAATAPATAAAPAPSMTSKVRKMLTGAAAPAAATAATTTAAAAPAVGPKTAKTTSQICSGQYQAAKANGSLTGQTWGKFLSACADNIKNYAEAPAQAPAEPPAIAPAQAKTIAATPAAIPTTDANGKPLSAGEVAFRQRIHACSQEWQSEKAAGTLPTGSKWPQFWSACNTQLKAQG